MAEFVSLNNKRFGTNNKTKSGSQNLLLKFLKFTKILLLQLFENHKELKNSSIWPKLAFLSVNQTA